MFFTVTLFKKRGLILIRITSLCLVTLFLNSCSFLEEDSENVVRIYTHSSFTNYFGPGTDLKNLFEKKCGCKIEFVSIRGAALITKRLQVEKNNPPDVVLGLGFFQLEKALKNFEWMDLEIETHWKKEIKPFVHKKFIPYDWAPLTWIYHGKRRLKKIKNWNDLLKDEFKKKINIQDPRMSSLGLHLLFWLSEGDSFTRRYIKRFKKSIFSISPSWSLSYGIFKKKKDHFVFSHITSLIYHWKKEKDQSYQYISWDLGHPYQVEYVGIPKQCSNCKKAFQFVQFLLTYKAQKILSEKNYMFPVVRGVPLTKEFSRLPQMKLLPIRKLRAFVEKKHEKVKQWKKWID